MKHLRLSVRELVEYCLRSGDIDNRHAAGESMNEGARAHRKIQRSMGEGYKKEVDLKLNIVIAGTPVLLHGRADGIITAPDGSVTVDEIKTTSMPMERYNHRPGIPEAHLAQAKCYAYMLLANMEEKLESVTIQLTYYYIQSDEIQRRSFLLGIDELSAFFNGLIEAYSVYLRFQADWRDIRECSIKAARFPYKSYREGQRAFAVAAYSAIERGKRLYAQAPTGIGKTISALFPSIKAMGEGKAEKIFYLTAKTVTRAVAEDALGLMSRKGLRLKSITFRAKEKLCPLEEVNCNPIHCPRAKGHYNRVNEAILSIMRENDIITADMVEAYAKEHNVCPHEFMLDASLLADLIICDYNHVFDPAAKLRRYFGETENEYVFLIDEAHNLYERAREMYTATLAKSGFDKARKGLPGRKKADRELKSIITRIIDYFRAVRDETRGEKADTTLDADFTQLVSLFVMEADIWLSSDAEHPYKKEMLALYFDALFFLDVSALFTSRYARITQVMNRDASITLFCLDPSEFIAQSLDCARAAVLFSATLTPLSYYREILGGTDTDGMLSLPSPFDPRKLRITLNYGISTKYPDRQSSIEPIVEAVRESISGKMGNYIVYFPSYAYMKEIYASFCEACPGTKTIIQQSDMNEKERADFLMCFDESNTQTLVGFCVLGGAFSEGIDLTGGRLIGVIIVGVGLPKLSLRQNLIKKYFDERNGGGYDYAYTYPGMNKVLQAVGRVIRTEEDEGTALLIDTRYRTQKYWALFPEHWRVWQGDW